MKCIVVQKLKVLYVDQEIERDTTNAIEHHIGNCNKCKQKIQFLKYLKKKINHRQKKKRNETAVNKLQEKIKNRLFQ